MKLSIRHQLKFGYSKPVFLDPTLLRLRPRDDFSQRLESFQLESDPPPEGRSDELDLLGNPALLLWFNGACSRLSLTVESRVETLLVNPFHYLVTDPQTLKLPARYHQENRLALNPYLHRPQPDKTVEDLARSLLMESDDNTLNFLYHATDYISREFRHVHRAQGEPLAPGKTLRRREGACRDLAVLFMDICRSLGLAARFVSGYKYSPDSADQNELHAWAEIYLPGAGWRGYDPSWGLAVADHHVALAAGPAPLDAMPVTGTFRGTDVLSSLEYSVEIGNLELAKR
ncbi:MAG TPA: transglutaminase family protein [bacterium]|nr:transglutaminase family protein [bacterium]